MTNPPPPPYGGYPPPYGAHPPSPYGGYPPVYAGYPRPQPTNTLAVASLVCAFVFAPLGIAFGHISLSQIKKSGEEGRGLAVAGLIISYVFTAFMVLVLVWAVIVIIAVGRSLEDMDGMTTN